MVDQTTSFDMMQPETIAKEYGGSKQKIALAMQQGLVDPTAGTLAGMFIDRMRSGDMLGQGAPPTVAQQVFAPPQQQQGGPPQPGGPGAMPPQQGMGGPPAGMGGPPPEGAVVAPPMQGLTDLPVPDQMFDEGQPSMAGGGLVAFAGGGEVGYDAFYNAIVGQESGGRYGIANAEGSGAMGLGQQMPDTVKAIAKRLGMPYDPGRMAGDDPASRAYQDKITDSAVKEAWDYGEGDPELAAKYYFAGPDQSGWKGKTAKYAKDISKRLGRPDEKPLSVDQAATGLGSLEPGIASEYVDEYRQMVPRDYTSRDELMAALAAERSPESKKAQKDQDMWSMLAQVGFGTAAGKSGNFLTDLGQAANAALPAAQEATAARKASDMDTLRAQVDLEASGNMDRERDAGMGVDLYKTSVDNLLRKAIADQEEQLKREGMLQEEILAGRQERGATLRARIASEASKPQVQRAMEIHYNAMRNRQRGNYKTYENRGAAPFGLFKKDGRPKADTELRAMALQAAIDQETQAEITAYAARPSQQAGVGIGGYLNPAGGGGGSPPSLSSFDKGD